MERYKIGIVEDERAIADLLEYGLKAEGFLTRKAYNGAEGWSMVESFQPDLLLLDWMLPDTSGLEICKKVTAAYNIPIVMITAKSDITDKILGLEFGADDYITKPFDLREVVARIRTILRRISQVNRKGAGTESREQVIRIKDLLISVSERLVSRNGEWVDLTPKEYDLLLMLIQNRGIIFGRTELLDRVWGYDYAGDTRTVDTHILRLRKKLGLGDMITTVFSIGYKFEKPADE